jgi:hypothetical protein
MRLDTEEHLPRLFFTETGLAMLRAMMADRRFADPEKFAHVRQELGIDPAFEEDPPEEQKPLQWRRRETYQPSATLCRSRS